MHGHSAARDAKARKATVKIALLAPYSSRMCATIDLSCPDPRWVWGTAEHGGQSLIRDLIEPVQSDEPASALGFHTQEFALAAASASFRVEGPRANLLRRGRRALVEDGDHRANEGADPDGR